MRAISGLVFGLLVATSAQAVTQADLLGTWKMTNLKCASGTAPSKGVPDSMVATFRPADASIDLEAEGCKVAVGPVGYAVSGDRLTWAVKKAPMAYNCGAFSGKDEYDMVEMKLTLAGADLRAEQAPATNNGDTCKKGDSLVMEFQKQP